MNTTDSLPNAVKETLTEGSLKAIETAFKEKLDLAVETALTQQDDLYATKLQQLIEAIDKDHTCKLKKIVEAIDRDNSNKLFKVIKKYESSLNREARGFKQKLVESISNYLEEYIDETIPTATIEEATKNKTATTVLANLRRVLAVDTALMSESVKDAIVDGKSQIDALTEKVDALTTENRLLKEKYNTTAATLLLESKTSNLSPKKKEYIMRVLSDKTPKFIKENFDYTLRLFEKKEQERLSVIKEEAFKARTVKSDTTLDIPTKKKVVHNPYVEELSRIR